MLRLCYLCPLSFAYNSFLYIYFVIWGQQPFYYGQKRSKVPTCSPREPEKQPAHMTITQDLYCFRLRGLRKYVIK